ncbi:unnamed protein product [Ostreobium quekettii]|uniref:Uncharacterized protein n=1 Tax=Ostreobium quekettii TaxID=121088 RepID=A0A8S1IWW1_9CHLO|nr:unnamed protein product [Ostreobium quekettii]|eukprot:evm.model.scf_346.2 EVM.evm.TU.scf_346.2   scf_346:30619-33869(+)
MVRSLQPLRLLRRGVGFAFRGVGLGVRKGVGGAVMLAWPARRKSRRGKRGGKARSGAGEESEGLGEWSATIDSGHFPQSLCAYDRPGRQRCQALATVGCRYWGNWLDGRGLLKVKVYEFAIYMDKDQMRQSELGRALRSRDSCSELVPEDYQKLRSSSDVDMSLVLRTSRSLPLKLVASEYERILKKRLVTVGGQPSDPQLKYMLSHLEDENVPQKCKSRSGHVRKGTTLTFKKYKNGHMKTFAGDVELGSIHSAKVCAALFDLYLGEQPVCKDAKMLAGKRVADFALRQEQQPEVSRVAALKGWGVMGARASPEGPCSSQGPCLVPRHIGFGFGSFPQIDFGHLSGVTEGA